MLYATSSYACMRACTYVVCTYGCTLCMYVDLRGGRGVRPVYIHSYWYIDTHTSVYTLIVY